MKTPWKNRLKSDRPRSERDFYATPDALCRAAFANLRRWEMDASAMGHGLDAGAGQGAWGRAFRETYPYHKSIGVDIERVPDGIYDHVYWNDFLIDSRQLPKEWMDQDLVYGNPPYSLAEGFIRRGLECVHRGGRVLFLLRLGFLESIHRGRGLFEEFPPKRVLVLMRRPSFFSTDGGKHTTDALSYALFLWEKGCNKTTELGWLDWDYDC